MIINAQPLPQGQVVGHVEVWVDDLPSTDLTVTVTRRQERREFLARGLVDVSTSGDVFARDFEAPFGIPHTYQATAVDESGKVIATAETEPIRLVSTRASSVVVHDPVRPGRSLTLALGKNALRGGSRALGGGAISVDSSSLPIAVAGRRGGWQLALDVVTYQAAQAEALDAMLGGYDDDTASGVLCFRPSSNVPTSIPRTFFGRVEAEPEWWPGGDGNGNPRAEWSLKATEVRPPAPGVVDPLVTWADWQAWLLKSGGWDAFNAAFPTWRDANRSLVALGMAAA